MDANFGLVHKKNAAKYDDTPFTSPELTIFLDQNKVDEFVKKQEDVSKSKNSVSFFL